jgi:4-amino-4-deoxy-L-arabinose transferase-like glycosyltransferase
MARTPSPASSAADPAGTPPYRRLKLVGLLLLCAAWVALGLFGHDPWKTEDAAAFGVAFDMMRTGDWLQPTLADEPYVERPPLAYAAAAGAGWLAGGLLPAHDAARLGAGIMLALTLLFLAAAGRELYERAFRWLPVLLFIGSVGLWDRAHQMSPEMGLLLGIAIAQYGFALALRRPAVGGALLGLGTAVAFLSRGLAGPLWLALTAAVLPIAFARWRNRSYALTIAVALAVALPLCASWPVALGLRGSPQLAAWWAAESIGDYFAPLSADGSGDPLYVLKNLPWFTWPALPLVVWTLWTRGRGFNRGLASPGIELPGTLAAVVFASLLAMAEPKAIAWMPLLLPLALLASAEVDTLPRGFSGALDWFGILTFGLLATLVWALWLDAYLHGISPTIAHAFRDTEPGYRPQLNWLAIAISMLLTIVWILLVRPARRTNRRAVLNWAVGMTLVWGLYMTIWLPYLDSRRSYRSVAQALARALPPQGCVASRGLGDPQRALLRYFGNIVTVREERKADHDCPTLIVQAGRQDDATIMRPGWEIAWTGSRRGDDTERFVVLRRIAP